MGTTIYQNLKNSEIKAAGDIIPILKQLQSQGVSKIEAVELLHKCNRRFAISDEQFNSIINVLVDKIYAKDLQYHYPVEITDSEVDFLKGIQDIEERMILFACLVMHKRDAHPTGWVRYNPDDIMLVLGYGSETQRGVNIILNKYIQANNISLKVIGSKQSVLCFNIDYENDKSPVAFYVCDNGEVMDAFNAYILKGGENYDY